MARLALLALLPNAVYADSPPQVLTSIKPLALISEEITAGTDIKVGYLLAPSVSEHNYALKISDIKKLSSAKIVVWLGDDLEPYLKSTQGSWLAPGDSKKSLALLAATTILDEHHHGSVDPHVWLSPILANQLAEQITARLDELYPAKRLQFDSNLKKFCQKTLDLDKVTENTLAPYGKTPFFVHHDAYGYFVKHYKLNQIGVLQGNQPDASLSLNQLKRLRHAMEGEEQKVCLFREPQLSSKSVPKLNRDQVKLGELDPLGIHANTYSELIKDLTAGFVSCFNK